MADELLNKDIIEILGLEKVSEEKKTQMREKMAGVLQNRIANRLDDEFTESQKQEFNTISETGDENKIATFLNTNVKNMEQIVIEETLKYKHEMAEQAENIKQMIQSK